MIINFIVDDEDFIFIDENFIAGKDFIAIDDFIGNEDFLLFTICNLIIFVVSVMDFTALEMPFLLLYHLDFIILLFIILVFIILIIIIFLFLLC